MAKGLSDTIHLWDSGAAKHIEGWWWTKCGRVVKDQMNVLYASTAERLRIPPAEVCKTCYRLGPPWLVAVK